MSWAASLPKLRPWASPAGYGIYFAVKTFRVLLWKCDVLSDVRLINVSALVDSIRQVGEAPEHPRKEYPGWIQAHHTDEPRRFLLPLPLFLLFSAAYFLTVIAEITEGLQISW